LVTKCGMFWLSVMDWSSVAKFVLCNIPKSGKTYQMTTNLPNDFKSTKWLQIHQMTKNISKDPKIGQIMKIDQMATKFGKFP
jgi:hypothetical protein